MIEDYEQIGKFQTAFLNGRRFRNMDSKVTIITFELKNFTLKNVKESSNFQRTWEHFLGNLRNFGEFRK